MSRWPLLAVVALLSINGCSGSHGSSPAASPSRTGSTSQPAASPSAGASDLTGATPMPSTAEQAVRTEQVNKTVRNADLVILTISSVSFADDETTVQAKVVNGHDSQVPLNPAEDMLLIDDVGNHYRLNPPPTNAKVEISPGATLSGSFVFFNPIDDHATTLTLVTCNAYGSVANEYSSNPQFKVSFPVAR